MKSRVRKKPKQRPKNYKQNIVPADNKSITDISLITTVVFSVLGVLSIIYVLYTDVDLFGKISGITFFYIVIIYVRTKLKDSNQRKLILYLIIIISSIILIWIFISLKKYNIQKDKEQNTESTDQRKTPFFDTLDQRCKILILPFQTDSKQQFEIAGSTIYRHLKYINEKEKLNANIVFANQLTGLDTQDSAEYFKNFHHADLIVYGQYYPAEGNTASQVRINYIANEDLDIDKMGKETDAQPVATSIVELSKGELQGNIQYVIQFIVAQNEYLKGNYSAAIKKLNKIRETYDPEIIDFLIGTSYYYLADYKESIATFKKCLLKNPDFVDVHINLCTAYLDINRLKDAAFEVDYLLRKAPKSAVTCFLKGNIQLKSGDFQGAIGQYTKSVSMNSKFWQSYFNRSLAKDSLKDYKGAAADFSQVFRSNDKNPLLYKVFGDLKHDGKDFQGAISEYNKAIAIDSKYARAYLSRGSVKDDLKDNSGAMIDYLKAIEFNPKFAEAYFNVGTLYDKLQKYDNAIVYYTKSIELNSKYADAYCNRGVTKSNKGDYKGSFSDFTMAININPKLAIAYSDRSAVRMIFKDYKGTIADCNRAINISPHFIAPYFNRGSAKYFQKDYKGSIIDYSKSIEMGQNDSKVYDRRGEAKNYLKNYKGAIEDFSEAIRLDSTDALAYRERAVAKQNIKDFQGGLADIAKAKEIETKNK